MIDPKLLALLEMDLTGKKVTYHLNPPPPDAKGRTISDEVRDWGWGIRGSKIGPRFFVEGKKHTWEEAAGDIAITQSKDAILLIGVQQPTDITIHL